MESDDEFQLLSSTEVASPLVPERKLKRLKKVTRVSEDASMPDQSEALDVSFAKFVRQESEKSDGQDLEESNKLSQLNLESEGVDGENKVDCGICLDSEEEHLGVVKRALEFDSMTEEGVDGENKVEGVDGENKSDGVDGENKVDCGIGLDSEEYHLGAKRALEFDFMTGDIDNDERSEDLNAGMESGDLRTEKPNKARPSEDAFEKEIVTDEKKNKRVKTGGDVGNSKGNGTSKKTSEKERREHIAQLRAESQRLLRQTRDASFKPMPLVPKPVFSVLEKIRKRKLELSKKSIVVDYSIIDNYDDAGHLREITVEHGSEGMGSEKGRQVASEVAIHPLANVEDQTDAMCISRLSDDKNQSSSESIPSQRGVDEKVEQTFRAPIDGSQELFSDSQTSYKDETPNASQSSPLEEFLAPSMLAMKLKLGSASPDCVSDEEDDDKENVDPYLNGFADLSSSPDGGPVKAFLDDEAEEEDDSDNDMRLQDNEEDDETDAEDLKDMIAIGFKENPIDSERRNQLHQKWLEQQDEDGTEKLMQKLKCGSTLRKSTLPQDEDEEEGENDNDMLGDEATEDYLQANTSRMNLRKVKQMLPQMFTDKDDAYFSDDEETEQRLAKQCLVEKAVEKTVFLSPAEDENSRDVFGLIKKLNTMPETKKKTRTSSFPDVPLGGSKNTLSKSSFLSRGSNQSLPPSQNNGSSFFRSFIFGRDDSNSRSSASTTSEEVSETVDRENRPARIASAKFSYSQVKSSTQNSDAQTKSNTSLFEILRKSSIESKQFSWDNVSSQSESVFAAFKLEKAQMKKPIKMEGRI